MTLTEAPGAQTLTDHKLLKLTPSANVLKRLVLRYASLIAVIKSLVFYSKTFGSSYDATFKEARTSNICENVVTGKLLKDTVEPTYLGDIRVTRVVRWHPGALQRVRKVNVEGAAGSTAGGKDGPGIKNLDTTLFFD